MKTQLSIIAFILSLFITNAACAAKVSGQWWEVTQKMEMPGMPDFSSMMPGGGAAKICMSNVQEKQPYRAEDNGDCVISDVKTSGNTTSFKMLCKGENAMSGSGEITRTANSFSQKLKVQSSDGDMMMVSTGKRVGGACSIKDESNQMQAEADKGIALGNKLEAEAAANTKKFCAVETRTIDPQMLALGAKYFDVGSGSKLTPAPCKTEQKTYCSQVRKVAGVPAGYRKYDEIKRAFVENPELATAMYYFDPVKTCKIDPAPLHPHACGVAKKELSTNNPWDSNDQVRRKGFDDWNFMTVFCSADAKTYYKKACINWQSDKTTRYDWCNAVQDWKSSRVDQSADNSQSKQVTSSDVVEDTKTRAMQEGVSEGLKQGMNKLKSLF